MCKMAKKKQQSETAAQDPVQAPHSALHLPLNPLLPLRRPFHTLLPFCI